MIKKTYTILNLSNLFLAFTTAFSIPFGFLVFQKVLAAWLLLFLVSVILRKKIVLPEQNRLLFFVFTSFFILYLVGYLYSSNKAMALAEISRKIYFLVIPIIWVNSFQLKEQNINNVKLSFIGGNFVALIICFFLAMVHSISFVSGELLFQAAAKEGMESVTFFQQILQGDSYFSYNHLSAFNHPTYFSMTILFSIILLIDLIEKKWFFSKKRIWFAAFLGVFFLGSIFLLQSKMGFISALLVLLICTIRFILQQKKVWLYIIAGIFVVISGIVFIKYSRLNSLVNELGTISETYEKNKYLVPPRYVIWKASFDVIEDTPFFGFGSGDVKDVMIEKYNEMDYKLGIQEGYNLHNQYLQTFLSFGYFGLLYLLIIFIWPLILSIRKKDYLLAVFLLILVINTLAESIFNRLLGISFFCFFYSMLIFTSSTNSNIYSGESTKEQLNINKR